MKRLVHVSIASLLLIACGSDGPNFGPETTPTSTQQTGVTATEQSITLLAAADTQPAASVGAVLGLAMSSLLLIVPASSERSTPGNYGLQAFDPQMLAAISQASADDCAVVTANSVVWHHCTQNGFTIDGMVSWSPGHVDVDLHLTGAVEGSTFDLTLAGNIAVTASSIKSNMTLAATQTSDNTTISKMVDFQTDVQITRGCITSGTLTVTMSGSEAGARNGAVQVIWTDCHVFRVRNA